MITYVICPFYISRHFFPSINIYYCVCEYIIFQYFILCIGNIDLNKKINHFIIASAVDVLFESNIFRFRYFRANYISENI